MQHGVMGPLVNNELEGIPLWKEVVKLTYYKGIFPEPEETHKTSVRTAGLRTEG
jgi:hypothetical protein